MRRHPDVIALTLLVIAVAWFSHHAQASAPVFTGANFRVPVTPQFTFDGCPGLQLQDALATFLN